MLDKQMDEQWKRPVAEERDYPESENLRREIILETDRITDGELPRVSEEKRSPVQFFSAELDRQALSSGFVISIATLGKEEGLPARVAYVMTIPQTARTAQLVRGFVTVESLEDIGAEGLLIEEAARVIDMLSEIGKRAVSRYLRSQSRLSNEECTHLLSRLVITDERQKVAP